MSPGLSKLNPYAAEYVPLAKRREEAEKLAPVHSDSSPQENTMPLHPDEVHGIYGSSSQEYCEDEENQADDDVQLESDVAYLQTQFPTISEQSLLDVYCVNEYDLDSSFDMLSQLENSDSVLCKSLPDSLDIGDVSEPQILPEIANLKIKEVAAATVSADAQNQKHAQPESQVSK